MAGAKNPADTQTKYKGLLVNKDELMKSICRLWLVSAVEEERAEVAISVAMRWLESEQLISSAWRRGQTRGSKRRMRWRMA